MRHFTKKLPPGVRRFFRLPQNRARLLHEMDDELASHIAMRVDELRAMGLSDADAEAEALRRFGNTSEFRDYAARRALSRTRQLGSSQFISEFSQDARAAIRQLRRAPALSALVVLVLAVTIGATTAVYGVVRQLLIDPLPYRDGNGIVSLEIRHEGDGNFRWDISAKAYRAWAARARTLEDFAAYTWGLTTIAVSPSDARARDTVRVAFITPSFLSMLRVRTSIGRDFTTDDARRRSTPVVLLSDPEWRNRFNGSPGAIGQSITVGGESRTIVGVVPAGVGQPVQGEDPPAVWLPLNVDSAGAFLGFARLRSGVSSTTASRELDAILRTLPDTTLHNGGQRAEAHTARDRLEPQQRRSVEVLFAAACALLLIACADIAGLLLMRGWARRREFAIRQALGAGRGRLTRLLLTESLLLAAPSSVLGVLVAWLALRPQALGYFAEVHLDGAMLAWAAAISVVTVLLFGAGPAFLACERSLDVALRVGGSGSATGRAAGRAHAGLVVAQVALSLVLLAAAGVLARSVVALVRTPVGYQPSGLYEITLQRAPTPDGKPPRHLTPAERAATLRTLRATIAAAPGVTEIAIGARPMNNIEEGPAVVEGATGVRPGGTPITGAVHASADYFRVARISLRRGRTFDSNAATARNEIILNEALARHLWPERDALGARLKLSEGPNAEWLTVVGIAGDVRMPGRRAAEFYKLQMYIPMDAAPRASGPFILRTRMDPSVLRPVLARAVARAGVGATLKDITSAESTLEYAYRGPRFALRLFAAFSLLAVVLAAVGLFGIIAFAVARRTREIGIRVALGADATMLARTIVGRSLRLVAVGCAIGLAGAYAASRALTALAYGVSPTDPVALVGAVLLLTLVALGASAVPVRRALAVDPTETLRAE